MLNFDMGKGASLCAHQRNKEMWDSAEQNPVDLQEQKGSNSVTPGPNPTSCFSSCVLGSFQPLLLRRVHPSLHYFTLAESPLLERNQTEGQKSLLSICATEQWILQNGLGCRFLFGILNSLKCDGREGKNIAEWIFLKSFIKTLQNQGRLSRSLPSAFSTESLSRHFPGSSSLQALLWLLLA